MSVAVSLCPCYRDLFRRRAGSRHAEVTVRGHRWKFDMGGGADGKKGWEISGTGLPHAGSRTVVLTKLSVVDNSGKHGYWK